MKEIKRVPVFLKHSVQYTLFHDTAGDLGMGHMGRMLSVSISSVVAGGEHSPSPLNFGLWKIVANIFIVGNFASRNAKCDAEMVRL